MGAHLTVFRQQTVAPVVAALRAYDAPLLPRPRAYAQNLIFTAPLARRRKGPAHGENLRFAKCEAAPGHVAKSESFRPGE